jgi:beta-xylosidase
MKKLEKKQKRVILEYARLTLIHEINVAKDRDTTDVDEQIRQTKNELNINSIKAGRVRLCIFKMLANKTEEIDTTFSRLTTDLLEADPVYMALLEDTKQLYRDTYQ